MLYSIRFTITGRIEVEAADSDEAYDLAEKMGARQLVEDGLGVTIDLETPECEE
jgi:hypothetical protein